MVLLIRGGGKKPVVLIHKLHHNDFDKSVNKKNISWPEYFSFYKATTPLSINYLHLSIHRRTTCNENKLVLKWRITVQAIPGHKLIRGNKNKARQFFVPTCSESILQNFYSSTARVSRNRQLEHIDQACHCDCPFHLPWIQNVPVANEPKPGPCFFS